MKIYILSYDRPNEQSTYFLLKKMGFNPKVVIHHKELFEKYVEGGVDKNDLIVSGAKYGLACNRNFVLKNLVSKNEWHIQASDDAVSFKIVEDKYYNQVVLPVKKYPKQMKKIYENEAGKEEIEKAIKELKNMCERVGANLGGFAITKNHFFRDKKWNFNGLIDGKFILIKGNKTLFDENVFCIDDHQFTAENILRYGVVVRNNFLFPDFKRYTKGGFGTEKERYKRKMKDCEYLIKKYNGFFKIEKKGNYKVDLKFLKKSNKQIENWRKNMLGCAI
ncbi:hypothetical protein [Persephonella sp.]